MVLRVEHEFGDNLAPLPRVTSPRIANARVRPVPPPIEWAQQTHRAARALPKWMVRGYLHFNASDLAAAVAFNAVVALVPTFLLFASIAGYFLRDDYLLAKAVDAILWSRPPAQARQALNTLATLRENSGWLGIFSVIGFAWIGTNFISCLARSMNRVYGVPNRQFVHERARDFALILVFAVFFLLASLAAAVPTFFVSANLGYYWDRWAIASTQVQTLSYVIAYVAAALLFLVLYRIVPNAGQRLADVWPGALVASLLFVVMTQAFPLYLRFFNAYSQYAKVLGFGLLLIIWFYALAHVFLFGTYVNATYFCYRHGGRRRLPLRMERESVAAR